MKNKFIKFICLVSMLFSIQSFASPINKIDFVGLNVISSSSLIELLPVQIGDQYNEQTSNKIIEVLFQTGYFSDIKIDINNDNLLITLIENPVVKYFDVTTGSGSIWADWLNLEPEFLDETKLTEYIESNKLSAGNIYAQSKFSDFVSTIKDEYIAAGFYNVQIDSNIDVDMKNRIGIINFVKVHKECHQWLKSSLGPINTIRFVLSCLERKEPQYVEEKTYITAYKGEDFGIVKEYVSN